MDRGPGARLAGAARNRCVPMTFAEVCVQEACKHLAAFVRRGDQQITDEQLAFAASLAQGHHFDASARRTSRASYFAATSSQVYAEDALTLLASPIARASTSSSSTPRRCCWRSATSEKKRALDESTSRLNTTSHAMHGAPAPIARRRGRVGSPNAMAVQIRTAVRVQGLQKLLVPDASYEANPFVRGQSFNRSRVLTRVRVAPHDDEGQLRIRGHVATNDLGHVVLRFEASDDQVVLVRLYAKPRDCGSVRFLPWPNLSTVRD